MLDGSPRRDPEIPENINDNEFIIDNMNSILILA